MQQEFTPRAGRAESPGEFLDRLRRSGQTRRALANPMRGVFDVAMEVLSGTAESTPSFLGGPLDRSEGILPRKIDIGPVSLGTGPLYQPELGIGDTQIPLNPLAGLMQAVPESSWGEPKPESTEAFRDFIQQTPVSPAPGLPPEPMSLSRASATIAGRHEERPWHEQLGLGLIDVPGTVLTGGLGVTKLPRLAGKGVGLARQIPDLFKSGPITREMMEFAIPRPAANKFWTGMPELPPGRQQPIDDIATQYEGPDRWFQGFEEPPSRFTEPVMPSAPGPFEPSRVVGTTTETVVSPAERVAMEAL